MTVTANVEKLDVKFAMSALGNAAPNRKVKRRSVEAYTRSMLAGHWKLNGEPVVFYIDGTLADGQHRMMALIDADKASPGITVPMLVVRGVEMGVRFNTGVGRSISDQFQINGGTNAHESTAFARAARLWSDEYGLVYSDYANLKATYDEIEDFITRDPHFETAMRTPKADHIMPRRALKFVRWLFCRVPSANEWFDTVLSGADLSSSSPAFVLRNFLLRHANKGNSTAGQDYFTQFMTPVAVTIKAWNAHVQRRKIEVLRYMETDKFPIPFGLLPRE